MALYLVLIICCFTKTLRGAHHTPGFIAHVKSAIKKQSLASRITMEYEFMNSGEKEMAF